MQDPEPEDGTPADRTNKHLPRILLVFVDMEAAGRNHHQPIRLESGVHHGLALAVGLLNGIQADEQIRDFIVLEIAEELRRTRQTDHFHFFFHKSSFPYHLQPTYLPNFPILCAITGEFPPGNNERTK